MERISTSSAYNGVLTNLLNAENKQTNIGDQISSQEVSTDLKGYASHAETLTALQSVQAQVTGYLANGQVTSAQLTTQDTALTQLGSASTSATQAVTTALAAGNGDTLMQNLDAVFQSAAQGLNTTFNGAYVFSGGNSNTPPVNVTSLNALGATTVASVFTNAQHVTTTQITPSSSIQTGFLASTIGTPLFNVLQAISAFNQGVNGPFSGALTQTQTNFLQGELSNLSAATTGLNTVTSQNGEAQAELTTATTDLTNQQSSLTGLIGNITNVNLAQASSDLSQAQLAVQASSRVFEALQSSSLLAVLQATGAA
jgi:flagellar hook-associated protein 3 FlgL